MTHQYESCDDEYDDKAAKPGRFRGLIAVGVACVLALLMMAASRGPGDCEHITNSSARLACYDAVSSQQPAKGAAIPIRH